MKRKPHPKAPEPIVSPEILEQAKRSIAPDSANAAANCTVCGAEVPAASPERLCWVCRRLKISAWRDIEQQMPAQE